MRGMKTKTSTSASQANLRSKAAAMLEPGLSSVAGPATGGPVQPMNPPSKPSRAVQMANGAQDRPVAYAKGGLVKQPKMGNLKETPSVTMPSVPGSGKNPIAARQAINPRMAGMKPSGFAKGGKVHDDEAQDKKLIAKMIAASEKKEPKGMKSGGKLNISKAIKKPGQLHKDLGVPQGEKIPESKLKAAASKPGKIGQRARFAETLKGFKAGGPVQSQASMKEDQVPNYNMGKKPNPMKSDGMKAGGAACMAAGGAAKIRRGVANPDGSPKSNAVPRSKLGRY